MDPQAQQRYKQAMVLEQLEHIGEGIKPAYIAPVLEDTAWQYRYKARIGVKFVYKKDCVLVGFREKYSPFVTVMSECKVLHPAVGEKITALRDLIGNLDARQDIPQIEIAVGEQNCALVFRHLKPLSESDSEQLSQFGQQHGLQIYLQSGGLDSLKALYPAEPEVLYYDLAQQDLKLEFKPLDFTQVNPAINRKMIAQALDWLQPQQDERLLELFCGLGNFTLAFAHHCQQIMAVEGDVALVQRAQENARNYGFEHINYAVADLQKQTIEATWLHASYDIVLLDPPRSGAQEILAQLPLQQIKRILYVSCNPATLARDSVILSQAGFKLQKMGIMDMFPHTAHVETMALFSRN